MIILRIIGSLLIVTSSSLIGYIYGKKYSDRLNNILHMKNCVRLLETEIIYGANPVPEAFLNIYNKGNKKFSFIFKYIRDYLFQNKNANLLDGFLSVEDVLKEELLFKKEDVEVFLSLGRMLGNSDRSDQEKNFKLIFMEIGNLEEEAREEKEKNEKVYKKLGLLFGVALVIILL